MKALLKQARDAIKNKDYETSMKLSKAILKEDKYNYVAMVFLGLSLQELGPTEQAPKAFRKAIDMNPSNPLAWNGLINYHEKLNTDEAKKELVELYMSALVVETNGKKLVEYCEKLAKLQSMGDALKIAQVIYSCAQKMDTSDVYCIYEIFCRFCENLGEIPSELQSTYEECLARLIDNKDNLKLENYSSYLTLLYKQSKYEDLLHHAENMHMLFDKDTVSLAWICKIFNQLFLEDPNLAENHYQKANECAVMLLEVEPQNTVALFTKSIALLKGNNIIESKDLLIEVTTLRPGLLHAWILLTRVCLKINLLEEAQRAALFVEKLLKSTNYSNRILENLFVIVQIELLSKSSNDQDSIRALDLYEKIKDEELKKKCIEFIIMANINLKRFPKAQTLISNLESINEKSARLLEGKLLCKQERYKEALQLLENNTDDSSEWWTEIGLLYWSLEEYENCLVPFLKAAKCDPNSYLCFVHLGRYYHKVEDFDKSRRCYEKAFKINSKSAEVGTELIKIYSKQKNWKASQSFLEGLTTGLINSTNSWAWLQLGLSYLDQEEYSKAIDNLRFVVRIDAENTHCWESLADAYFARGSYTSALKCYQKSLELTKNKLYPLLQIANIKKILGLYVEARVDFEEILQESGDYVPALKGLSETCMCQARECYRDHRLATARNHAQSALDSLTLAIQQRSEFSCLWKLIGDSCLFVAKFPEKYCCLFISKALLYGTTESEERSMIEREDLYTCATRCYCKAVGLTDDNVAVWHDLGTCYMSHGLDTEDVEKRELLFSYAMSAARHCTTVDPSNWQHWNLLGNVAMEQNPPNFALAQHAFIKAVSVDHNCAVSWCNLGGLYLIMDDIKLANKAFSQGQRADPNYVNSWIGQAMIAESMGHEEAMDLFRHSTQLGHHQQGGIGYGHWVCQTLLAAPPNAVIYSIHNMHAIPVACDALTWYTEKNPDDGCAWNMLGILRERMGLKNGTLEAFKNSYRLSPKHRDLSRINYGRILAKLGKYSAAIDMFQEVQEATFNSGSGLALALFKDEQYEESYCAYEQVLHWLTEEQSCESDLLVALASMAYMFEGPDTAKTLLTQSIQLKPPSPWGLYASLSLGLLHDDTKLASTALEGLETLKDDKQCLGHYSVLLSYVYLLQRNTDKAVRQISKLVHRHPDNASVWLSLALLLLRVQSQRKPSMAAAKCALIAMKLGQINMDITKVLGLVSLGSSLVGEQKHSMLSAQKAVHCYPNVADGWAVLSSAILRDKSGKFSKIFVCTLLQHVDSLKPSTTLCHWAKSQLTVLNNF